MNASAASSKDSHFSNVLKLSSRDSTALQGQINETLAAVPGGKQVSQYEITWQGGHVAMAFPAPGHKVAPPASAAVIGRDRTARNIVATSKPGAGQTSSTVTPMGSSSTCPYGAVDKWYCWYHDDQFDGRRLQFLDYYCPGRSSGGTTPIDFDYYTFNNQASSWVNNSQRTIKNYDGANATGTLLWTDGKISNSPFVGTPSNDKLTSATVC